MRGKSTLLTAPSLTHFFFKSRTSSSVDEWSCLDAARPTPSYPWGGFGSLLPSPYPLLLGAEFPSVSPGEIVLGHTTDFVGFTADPWQHELTWSSLPPKPFTHWHQWEMTQQWPTQKDLMGCEHSPCMAQWALWCCQSTEEPSPRKGTSCWM